MTKNGDRVLQGLIRMDTGERSEVLNALIEYLNAESEKKAGLAAANEKRASVDLGPLDSSRCPCCGQ